MHQKSQTNWERVLNMTDEEIERNALSDPDSLPLPDDYVPKNPKMPKFLSKPKAKLFSLDNDLLMAFPDEATINQTLRWVVENHISIQQPHQIKGA